MQHGETGRDAVECCVTGGCQKDNKSGASVKENYRKTTEVVRPCEENDRGAHSERNAGCGRTREMKKREAKP